MTRANHRKPRCAAKNSRHEPCQMAPVDGSLFCFAHAPRSGRERAEARKRGGRNRRTPHAEPDERRLVSLRDLASVQALLEEAVADTLVQSNSSQRSRTLGYLLGVAIKTLEIGELEERLIALEQRMAATLAQRVA